jgi:uncharacterized membrane protein YdjX (TVP38/TMEM64 family)
VRWLRLAAGSCYTRHAIVYAHKPHVLLARKATVTFPTEDRRPSTSRRKERGVVRRWIPLSIIVALIVVAYALGLHREISFEALIRNHAAIDRFVAAHGIAAVAGYVALYIAVVSLSLPGGAILTVAGGFLFGPLVGSVAAGFGALAGATILFLVARSAAGEFLTRRAGRFAARLAEGFCANAFNYLLFLRLVPFPFWLVNLAPALFGVRLSTFVAATAIGIIPATVAFAVFGAGLESVIEAQESQYNACLAAGGAECGADLDLSHVLTPTLAAALAALGVLALVPVFARRIWGRKLDACVPPNRV